MASRRPGLVFAVLALLMQVWVGAAAPVVPAPDLAGALCGTAGGHPSGHGGTGHDGTGHEPGCALCPACATLAHHAPLLPVPPMVPRPGTASIPAAAWTAQPTGVPHRTAFARARAPPTLS